jgi:hypothetical protein
MKSLVLLSWLIRYPLPLPKAALAQAMAVLVSMTLLLPFSHILTVLGLSVPALCVVAGVLAVVCFNLTLAEPKSAGDTPGLTMGVTLLVTLGWLAAFLFVPSVAVLQHLVTYYLIFQAMIMLLIVSVSDQDSAQTEGWTDMTPFRIIQCTNALAMMAWAVLNEIFMRDLSEAAWVVSFALTPLAIHPLACWTIIALQPYEKTDGTR